MNAGDQGKRIYSKIIPRMRNSELFSRDSKKNIPKPLITKLMKQTIYNSKRSSPLPPLSSSLEINFENYLSVSINKCFKNKVYLKKTKFQSHRPSENLQMFLGPSKFESFMAHGEEYDKRGKRSKKKHPGFNFSTKDQSPSGIISKPLPKVLKTSTKVSKECDVQTNELDFDFHLIYEDEGKLEKLALDQLKQIEFYENFKSVSL
jgi:hypothetical protein